MASSNKQTEFDNVGTGASTENVAGERQIQLNVQAKKKSNNRKLLLLVLLMFLLISQIVLLSINSSSINRIPETSISDKVITAAEIKRVNTELKEVISDLKELNKVPAPALKNEPVTVKKAIVKPVAISVSPVVARESVKLKPKALKISPPKKKPPALMVVSSKKLLPPRVKTIAVAEKIVDKKTFYIKYDTNGSSLADAVSPWACVLDTQNGLMWETKSVDDVVRHSDNLYSWFNPQSKSFPGIADGGRCQGSVNCDTNAYVQAMNQQNYCGHNDWQLPTREEMLTLVNRESGDDMVTIDEHYFPTTKPSWYWTSSENDNDDKLAWYVLFRNGFALNDLKKRPKHIRLVRTMTEITKSNSHVY